MAFVQEVVVFKRGEFFSLKTGVSVSDIRNVGCLVQVMHSENCVHANRPNSIIKTQTCSLEPTRDAPRNQLLTSKYFI